MYLNGLLQDKDITLNYTSEKIRFIYRFVFQLFIFVDCILLFIVGKSTVAYSMPLRPDPTMARMYLTSTPEEMEYKTKPPR